MKYNTELTLFNISLYIDKYLDQSRYPIESTQWYSYH